MKTKYKPGQVVNLNQSIPKRREGKCVNLEAGRQFEIQDVTGDYAGVVEYSIRDPQTGDVYHTVQEYLLDGVTDTRPSTLFSM